MADNIFKRMLSSIANTLPRSRPFQEMGSTGVQVSGGFIRSTERNPQWIGTQRWKTAADIVTNVSIVAAATHYFLNVCARPRWTVVPSSDKDPEALELAAFVEEVINGMEQPWEKVIRKGAMYRFHGFAIQEWTALRRDDGRIGLKGIETRPVQTIERWEVADDGTILGVWQRSPQTNKLLGLPRSKFLYLVEDTLTDSPEGMGILRHMAEPYNRLKQFLALETIAFERDMRGTPVGRAPLSLINAAIKKGDINAAEGKALIQGMQDFVEAQVKQQNTGMLLDSMPYESQAADGHKVSSVLQWGMELLTGSANGLPELSSAIDRVQREMARIVGAEHLMMGDSSGNRALAQQKAQNLYLIANSVLRNQTAVATQDVINPLWTLNGFPEDKKPWFQAEDVTFKEVDDITRALKDMAAAGAVLSPDDPAIDDVRDLIGVSRSTANSDTDLMLTPGVDDTDEELGDDVDNAAEAAAA